MITWGTAQLKVKCTYIGVDGCKHLKEYNATEADANDYWICNEDNFVKRYPKHYFEIIKEEVNNGLTGSLPVGQKHKCTCKFEIIWREGCKCGGC